MGTLKTVVFVLTALVIAAVGVVLGGILMLAKTGGTGGGTGGKVEIVLPPQAWVAETQSLGDRLMLRVEMPDGSGTVYLVEPGSGKVIGTVDLKRAP